MKRQFLYSIVRIHPTLSQDVTSQNNTVLLKLTEDHRNPWSRAAWAMSNATSKTPELVDGRLRSKSGKRLSDIFSGPTEGASTQKVSPLANPSFQRSDNEVLR